MTVTDKLKVVLIRVIENCHSSDCCSSYRQKGNSHSKFGCDDLKAKVLGNLIHKTESNTAGNCINKLKSSSLSLIF